jgi:23S rRNA (cytidine1920-2'-O)/16S rRNA (cytidine1409-2'-O)-methyltransferase
LTRLDVALVERGLVGSRSRAADLVKRGLVRVNGAVVVEVARKVSPGDELSVPAADSERVSRAGEKLAALLRRYELSVSGWALDIGASTGGFTQVLLATGASNVVALDVGRGQLHPSLQQDARVIELSGVNFRDVTRESLAASLGAQTLFGFVTVDVSFISLTQILPVVRAVAPDAHVAALIKPQFEVGRTGVREGIVTNPALREDAIRTVLWSAFDAGLGVAGLISSPILGGHGNHEYLVWLSARAGRNPSEWDDTVHSVTGV